MGSLGVRLWGTRGLVPSPRVETAIFGGNTPSVQILYEDQLIMIDTGFGCANLGDELMPRILRGEALDIHIFFTHFHWDHIQGLPFFKPIYFPSTTLNIYSPEPSESTLENLDILFDGSYSPFESLLKMQAKVNIHRLTGALAIAGLGIDYRRVDHGDAGHEAEALLQAETYAYRFTTREHQSLLLMSDHEARESETNDALVAFGQNVDLLIHDGQWFADEYVRHIGWGHSSATQALDNALRMGARKTLITHHDPAREDRHILTHHRDLLKVSRFQSLDFSFAREDVSYAATTAKPLAKVG